MCALKYIFNVVFNVKLTQDNWENYLKKLFLKLLSKKKKCVVHVNKEVLNVFVHEMFFKCKN